METLVKVDIFFFITSIAVVVLTIACVFVAYYISRASREIEILSRKIRKEVDEISDDIDDIRKSVASKAWFVTRLFEVFTSAQFFKKMFGESAKKKKNTKRE